MRAVAAALSCLYVPALAAAQGSTGELTTRRTDHHLTATLSLYDDSGGLTPDGESFDHLTLIATWLRGAMTRHREGELVVGLDVEAAILATVFTSPTVMIPGALTSGGPHLGLSVGNVLVGPHVGWARHDTHEANRARGGIVLARRPAELEDEIGHPLGWCRRRTSRRRPARASENREEDQRARASLSDVRAPWR